LGRRPAQDPRQHAGLHGGVLGHDDVLDHGGLGHETAVLERPDETQGGPAVGRQVGDVPIAEGHGAGLGPDEAGDGVEHRRLAGAVGADEPEHGAVGDRQRDVLHGPQAAEADGEVGDVELHSPATAGSRRHSWDMPCGRSMITANRIEYWMKGIQTLAFLRNSGSRAKRIDPAMTPGMDPSPPTMAMAIRMIDRSAPKASDVTCWISVA